MTWLIEILKTWLEEQLLIKYCVIKHLILLRIQNMMNIKEILLQWSKNFLIKKTAGTGIKNENMSDRRTKEELYKPIIRKFKKGKVQSPFIDNIWAADLANMQLISKFNKKFRFLLFVIDIYIKYAWLIPLKDKEGTIITNAFQKSLKESSRKPNKIWVDTGSKFYNRSIKSNLEKMT